MGSIRWKSVKRTGDKLLEDHFDEFTENLEENKKSVSRYVSGMSKKYRNKIAGYITNEIKKFNREKRESGYDVKGAHTKGKERRSRKQEKQTPLNL